MFTSTITIVCSDCGGVVSSGMIPGTFGHGLNVLCVLDKGSSGGGCTSKQAV